jgi:hypothetical protein
MKRPRSRLRRVVVTDELLAAFRKAVPVCMARCRADIAGKLSEELRCEEIAAVQAVDLRANIMPFEHSPTDAGWGSPLQDALLAELTDAERETAEYVELDRKASAANAARHTRALAHRMRVQRRLFAGGG